MRQQSHSWIGYKVRHREKGLNGSITQGTWLSPSESFRLVVEDQHSNRHMLYVYEGEPRCDEIKRHLESCAGWEWLAGNFEWHPMVDHLASQKQQQAEACRKRMERR